MQFAVRLQTAKHTANVKPLSKVQRNWDIWTTFGKVIDTYYTSAIIFNKNIIKYCNSFVNSSSNFTIFGILVNNDNIDRSHDVGCHGKYFGGKICVTIVTKMGILLNWLAQAEYRVCNTVQYIIGKLIPSACQWCLRNCDIVHESYVSLLSNDLCNSQRELSITGWADLLMPITGTHTQ